MSITRRGLLGAAAGVIGAAVIPKAIPENRGEAVLEYHDIGERVSYPLPEGPFLSYAEYRRLRRAALSRSTGCRKAFFCTLPDGHEGPHS